MRSKDIRLSIQSVVLEFDVASVAVARLHFSIIDDPTTLKGHPFSRSDIRACARRLEITYLLRMFAVFEGGLRDLWQKAFGKSTQPPAERLLDAVAARLFIRTDTLNRAHDVRLYRNRVVHQGQERPEMTLAQCESSLARFLSEIAVNW